MKLGTLLLRDAVVTLSQLEEALRAQTLFGGRLGTNLVELGFVDLNTLGVSLARVLGVPLATQERFEAVQPHVIADFPVRAAEELLAFPLGPELRSPDTLGVALADPRKDVVDELSRRIDAPIAPYVAPELRILYYIERHYGVQRSARFLRPAERVPAAVAERRRSQPATTLPTPVRLEPRRARASAPPPAVAAPRTSYIRTCGAIDAAGHRDQIADALLDYCAGRFGAAVLFILRTKNAVGWRGQDADGAPRDVSQIALPLGAASALQVAHDTGLPFHGAPPSAGRPIERQLWRDLGVEPEPDAVVVVPVVVRKRVVNLLYVHAVPGAALDDTACDELTELALRASEAYVRLIQATKADGD